MMLSASTMPLPGRAPKCSLCSPPSKSLTTAPVILIDICSVVLLRMSLLHEAYIVRRGIERCQAAGRELPWFFVAALACVGQNHQRATAGRQGNGTRA